MEEKNEVNEIVREYKEVMKEYYIDIPGFKDRVYGKVSKLTNEHHIIYRGEVSHFFLFAENGPFYIGEDDNILVHDFEQAAIRVRQHLEDFNAAFSTKKNKFYK